MLERPRFEPAEVEPRILQRWLASGLFHADATGEGPTYSIAIPPPNVTGSLHMGHALNNTIQDVLVRYHRMLGYRTKWIVGTDHAGIATQMQVEKALRAEGLDRHRLGREEFVRRVWQWREHYGGRIIEQLKRLGASCDYDDERFTLDEGYVRAVQEAFIALYRKGYIYRDRYIVNWDPGSRSAISDLEVEMRPQTDLLYGIRYDLEGGGSVTIATVRPETLLGDTAVAVHPEDDRYRDLIGRYAILPLVGRRLPVIADPYVQREFGTGALKVTPAHDPADFELGRRHNLPIVQVIGEDGRMTAEAGERFAGLPVAEARQAVVEALREEGRIVSEQPYDHNVPYSHRSGVAVEPLVSLQWFMSMDELAKPALAAVEEGRVRIHPESHAKVYGEWLRSIRPWCISRQLWWGHRLPVFYCEACGEVHVERSQPQRCSRCKADRLRQDEDVLDTWFSSALWPFATLGWPERTPALAAFYPTDVLSTARDILFLWVARMVMMGLEFMGEVPFRDVYIHSIIQAPDGRRMSKSLGTGIDPLEQIEVHGADGLRFGLLAMSSTQDVRYSPEKVKQGQALANKLYNAARFALHYGQPLPGEPGPPQQLEDRWILSRLQRIKGQLTRSVERFEFAQAALALYDFIFGELCDWYLEAIKDRLAEAGPQREELLLRLFSVLRETCAVAHPLIPFVTEELWGHLGGEGLLAGARFPAVEDHLNDPAAEREMAAVIEAVVRLRSFRDTAGVPAGAPVEGFLEGPFSARGEEIVRRLARISRPLTADGKALEAVAIPEGQARLVLGGVLDPQRIAAGKAALRKRLSQELERARKRLENQGFIERAPADLVEAERAKAKRLEAELAAL
jgi:valyl-tRNA synthetase